MRIALLTIWHERNYGAELQTYATVKLLKELGHDIKVIDLRLSDFSDFNYKGKIGKVVSYFSPAEMKFRNFWSKNIPKTKRYKTISSLRNDPPSADLYLVGSDQVWNPELTKILNKVFFLDFGSDDIRRCSYASSFGTDTWNYPDLTEDMKRLLGRFSIVTCRENTGVKILGDIFGIKAQQVLDPTLLLGDYNELLGHTCFKCNQNTLVYYPLGEDSELKNYAINLAHRLRMTPLNNDGRKTIFKHIVWDRNSIEIWIRNISEAGFIITRSFHGIAFAIMYKKEFAAIRGTKNRTTRLESLLTALGLEERLFDSIETLDKLKPWNTPINYMLVNEKLELLRKESFKSLKQIVCNK